MFKFSGTRPSNLGVKDGKLAACPSSPNCVNSQAENQHGVSPLAFSGDTVAAMERLAGVVAAIPRTQVIQRSPGYLYVEFSTPLMGFVDDVEFYCDGKAIQVRSASRLGYSDLGVNRKRIEAIRAAFRGP
jgi:uncharacterized protein (DUF1499 family)